MFAKLAASAAVLLAVAPSVSALGSAVVHNQCGFDVYLWSVSNSAGEMVTLPSNGGEYSEEYQVNSNGGGVSIKLASDTAGSNVTQFEYTLETESLWYDVSNINGYPFIDYGLTLVPGDTACRSIICAAGTALCADAYNTPDENYATAECGSSYDAVLVLCSGDSTTTVASSVAAIASSAASTATAVTVSSFASTSSTKTTKTKESTSVTSTISSSSLATSIDPYSSTELHTTFITTVVTVSGSATASAASTTTTPSWDHNFGGGEHKKRSHVHRHLHRQGAHA